jgi:rod shape-determining protein MreD
LIKGKLAISLNLGHFDLDIITILIGYLFLVYGSATAALFAFGQGFVIDIYSGGPQGIFSFTYFSIFFLFWVLSRTFNISEQKGQFFLVLIAVGFKKLFIAFIFWASSHDMNLSTTLIWLSVASALITALCAPLAFAILNRTRDITGFKAEA